MNFHAVLDGELLVIRDGVVAPFSDLQQRLGPQDRLPVLSCKNFPSAVRLYDFLFDGVEDLRPRPFDARRALLETWFAAQQPARMDLSPLIAFTGPEDLAALREGAREAAIEGLMLKLGDSPYLAGRPKGAWWKWKRAPLSLDAVLMYAQRGHGKRSSYYSDYTFGVWNEAGELVPVGKAYSGYSDEELIFLDRWDPQPHHGTLRPGARSGEEPGLRGRFDAGAAFHPPQIRNRLALSAHFAVANRQAGGGGGSVGDRAGVRCLEGRK